MNNKKIFLTIPAIALGLGLSVLTVQANDQPAQNSNTGQSQVADSQVDPSSDTKATDLRVVLNAGNREHANLAANVLRNGFDGDKDFDASFKALDDNSNEIADAVGSVYGADARTAFLPIWRRHIVFFKDYTVATKQGNQQAKEKALRGLEKYIQEVSVFFSDATDLPKEAVVELIQGHVGLLKGTIDKHASGDFAGSYAQQDLMDAQIGTIADALAGAIVKQTPETFR